MARNDDFRSEHMREHLCDERDAAARSQGTTRDGRFYEAMPATMDRPYAGTHDEDADRKANKRAAKTGITTFLLGLLTGILATLLLSSLFNVGVQQRSVTAPTPSVQIEGR